MDPNLLFIPVVAAVIAAMILMKRLGLASRPTALRLIAQGARVIDVRTPQEFNADRLPHSTNVPLDRLRDRIQSVAPDRDAPVLLHCLSGSRSGVARRVLKQMGYTQAYNLGSITRARHLLREAGEQSGRSSPEPTTPHKPVH